VAHRRAPGLAGEPAPQGARRASLRKSQISRAVASLIAKRLLSRSIGEDDAREARLHLTARGRRVQQGIVRTAARRSDYLARTMTAKEVLTLQRQLDGLLVRASELLRESE
jgi:DNA-binding MarR family transcriptional regulator